MILNEYSKFFILIIYQLLLPPFITYYFLHSNTIYHYIKNSSIILPLSALQKFTPHLILKIDTYPENFNIFTTSVSIKKPKININNIVYFFDDEKYIGIANSLINKKESNLIKNIIIKNNNYILPPKSIKKIIIQNEPNFQKHNFCN